MMMMPLSVITMPLSGCASMRHGRRGFVGHRWRRRGVPRITGGADCRRRAESRSRRLRPQRREAAPDAKAGPARPPPEMPPEAPVAAAADGSMCNHDRTRTKSFSSIFATATLPPQREKRTRLLYRSGYLGEPLRQTLDQRCIAHENSGERAVCSPPVCGPRRGCHTPDTGRRGSTDRSEMARSGHAVTHSPQPSQAEGRATNAWRPPWTRSFNRPSKPRPARTSALGTASSNTPVGQTRMQSALASQRFGSTTGTRRPGSLHSDSPIRSPFDCLRQPRLRWAGSAAQQRPQSERQPQPQRKEQQNERDIVLRQQPQQANGKPESRSRCRRGRHEKSLSQRRGAAPAGNLDPQHHEGKRPRHRLQNVRVGVASAVIGRDPQENQQDAAQPGGETDQR